ncbi:MAG: hypothetical protein AVDCRST_MAG30-2820, partial [uncultured Solirubrobacteraceae bacterium]
EPDLHAHPHPARRRRGLPRRLVHDPVAQGSRRPGRADRSRDGAHRSRRRAVEGRLVPRHRQGRRRRRREGRPRRRQREHRGRDRRAERRRSLRHLFHPAGHRDPPRAARRRGRARQGRRQPAARRPRGPPGPQGRRARRAHHRDEAVGPDARRRPRGPQRPARRQPLPGQRRGPPGHDRLARQVRRDARGPQRDPEPDRGGHRPQPQGRRAHGLPRRPSINQAIADARRFSTETLIRDPYLAKLNQVCGHYAMRYDRWSMPTVRGGRNAAIARWLSLARKDRRSMARLAAPAKWRAL